MDGWIKLRKRKGKQWIKKMNERIKEREALHTINKYRFVIKWNKINVHIWIMQTTKQNEKLKYAKKWWINEFFNIEEIIRNYFR